MKRPLQLEEQVLCGLPEVVQHWVIGEPQHVWEHNSLCFFQHSLLDEGPFHRHYGLIFGRIPPGSSKTGRLTSRVTIESSLVINQDRED